MMTFWEIIIAAAAVQVIGALWYGKLFRDAWMKHAGITHEDITDMELTSADAYIGNFVMSVLMAYVLTVIFQFTDVLTYGAAIEIGMLAWLGFMLPIVMGDFLWEGKHFKLVLINGGNWLVTIIAMSVILVWL